jgi:ABC-type amino acid transport substrate-binding protein
MAKPTRRTLILLSIVVLCLGVGLLGLNNLFNTPPIQTPQATATILPYGELRVGVDISFPPFASVVNDELVGIDIDLAKALAQELGIPVRFVPLGFDGLYDALYADGVDVLISALVVNPARMDRVSYTRSYFDNGLMLISNANTRFENPAQLANQCLALEFGSEADTSARQWLRRYAEFSVLPYELPTYALDAVRLGDADVALVEATTYRLYLRDHLDWQTHAEYQTETLFALAVRIDRQNVYNRLDSALHRLIQRGILDEILSKWL